MLKLGVGSKVMLRRNLNVRKGLVNGATGTICKFKFNQSTVWIDCCTVDFYGKNHRRVIRRMLPLILSWANTIHKFQGTTVNKCVIDLGPGLFAKGMAYVAISRVRTLNGLAITNLDVSKLIRSSKFSAQKTSM
jgi:ATP-dependent exoDNAse (exonuclease V) alpha subunit